MIDYSKNNSNPEYNAGQTQAQDTTKSFLANVFTYMSGALVITGLLAYWFGHSEGLMQYLRNPVTGTTMLGYIVMFAPLAFVLVMSFAFSKLSSFALLILFIVYSAVMGISMSYIFLIYEVSSISSTFFITAATFGVMAVLGYTTKQDLTKFGSILFMALIGIIIASVVNMFIGNGMLDIIISCVGVLVFTGLTAYDVQKLKRIGAGIEYGSESANKLAIMGALNLYLDFVNLFMMLLRLFGSRR